MSNLLYVPSRRTEKVELSKGLKDCIINGYKQHPDKYANELQIIESLRDAIVAIPAESASFDPLFTYAFFII